MGLRYKIGDILRELSSQVDWQVIECDPWADCYDLQQVDPPNSIKLFHPAAVVEDTDCFKWWSHSDDPPATSSATTCSVSTPPTKEESEADALYRFFATPTGQWKGWRHGNNN